MLRAPGGDRTICTPGREGAVRCRPESGSRGGRPVRSRVRVGRSAVEGAGRPMNGAREQPPSSTAPSSTAPLSLAPLYAVYMTCSMGMMGFVAAAGPLAVSLGLDAWHIGLSATAGGLGWVLAARVWGRAADTIGRKRVLTVGQSGYAVAYVLLCLCAQLGIEWQLPPLIVLGTLVITRFGMGLAYSAIPAAGAAVVADRYPPRDRAGVMGRLGAAQASGILLGPALVAVLAGPSPTMVLFVLAVLPLPALAILLLRLPPDGTRSGTAVAQLSIWDPRLFRLLGASMAAMTAVGIAQIVIGFVAMDRLALPGPEALRLSGIVLSAVGVALIAAQLAVRRLGWTPGTLLLVGGTLSATGFVASALAPSAPALIAAYALSGFGAGWVFPAISATAANAVTATEQGRAAGAVSSAMGVGATLGPVLGGILYTASSVAPLLVAALAMVMAALVSVRMRRRVRLK